MSTYLFIVIGIVIGGSAAWMGTTSWYRKFRSPVPVVTDIRDVFSSVATEALRQNSELFLGRAQELLKGIAENSDAALNTKKAEIEGIINPLKETLTAYQNRLTEVEDKRNKDYGNLTVETPF